MPAAELAKTPLCGAIALHTRHTCYQQTTRYLLTANFLPNPLQEVTVHFIVPAAELAKTPLTGAIALHTLRDAIKAHNAGGVKLPEVRRCLLLLVAGSDL